MPPHLLPLKVSGREYLTQKATLQTSPYFQNLFSRWDDCSDRQEDGSYFIDADPDTFQHILAFMRRPSKFPLFWTKETGFDYALYNRLEAEADYFLLHDLRDWIRKKRYLDAVRTVIEVTALSEHQIEDGRSSTWVTKCDADTELHSFFGGYSGEKRYRSPCEIHPTHDKPVWGCGSCEDLMQAHGPQYDDPPKKLTLVTKRMELDEAVCVNGVGS
jgi:hypothetical protein